MLTAGAKFCGRGELPHQFRARLTGLALLDSERLVAVGDREVKLLSVTGALTRRWGTADAPWSVAVDGESLWVGLQGMVLEFDPQGRVVSQLVDRERLGLVTGVAAHAGRLLVADATNRKLQLYEAGKWIREVGSEQNTRGFMIPNGVLSVAYDALGQRFAVAHPQKHRVEWYTRDGEPAGKFGKFGNDLPGDFGGCCNPNTLTITPQGWVVTSEKAPPRLQVFDSTGAWLDSTAPEVFPPDAKNFALAAHEDGTLYVGNPLDCTVTTIALSLVAQEASHG